MSSFNEWLSQRDETIFNELMEPRLAGIDPKTRMDRWTYTDKMGNNKSIKELINVTHSKGNSGIQGNISLTSDGLEFLRRKSVSLLDKVDKLGRAVGEHFGNIESMFGGKLVIELPKDIIMEQGLIGSFINAINKLANKYNLILDSSPRDYPIPFVQNNTVTVLSRERRMKKQSAEAGRSLLDS